MNTFIEFWICFIILIVIIKIIQGETWLKRRMGREKNWIANALAAHSIFESEKKYPFAKGKRTPEQEFYRRWFKRKDLGGELSQRIAYSIARDIASEVRSMNSESADRRRTTTF